MIDYFVLAKQYEQLAADHAAQQDRIDRLEDQNDALQDERDALATKYAALVQLVEALPKLDGEITELTACVAVRSHKVTYKMIAALLAYRQRLAD